MKAIPIATHVCTVLGNMCTELNVEILNSVPVMAKINDFAHILSRNRKITQLL